MFNMNLYQGIFALLMVAGNVANGGKNELYEVRDFVERHPDILPMMAQFSLAMALGNMFIFQLQRDYGALVVTTTTTLRKFLSVLASALPQAGICQYLPLLPAGVCFLAEFPGCQLLSC